MSILIKYYIFENEWNSAIIIFALSLYFFMFCACAPEAPECCIRVGSEGDPIGDGCCRPIYITIHSPVVDLYLISTTKSDTIM